MVNWQHSEWSCLFDRHLDLSKEACESARGRWFWTPCVTLKACIDNRPETKTAGQSQAFENFAKDFLITDAKNKTQCRDAREGKSPSAIILNLLSLVYFPDPTWCSCLQSLDLTRIILTTLKSARNLRNTCVWVLCKPPQSADAILILAHASIGRALVLCWYTGSFVWRNWCYGGIQGPAFVGRSHLRWHYVRCTALSFSLDSFYSNTIPRACIIPALLAGMRKTSICLLMICQKEYKTNTQNVSITFIMFLHSVDIHHSMFLLHASQSIHKTRSLVKCSQ